jgi:hypothetical protein
MTTSENDDMSFDSYSRGLGGPSAPGVHSALIFTRCLPRAGSAVTLSPPIREGDPMPWQKTVDPPKSYQEGERLSRLLEPAHGLMVARELPGSVTAALSLISARASVWATVCLAAGYASRTGGDTAVAVLDLAAADPDAWPGTQEVTGFCAAYENLGQPPAVIVSCARLMTAAVPLALLTLAGFTIPDLQTCFDLYENDEDALARCLLEASGSALARTSEYASESALARTSAYSH